MSTLVCTGIYDVCFALCRDVPQHAYIQKVLLSTIECNTSGGKVASTEGATPGVARRVLKDQKRQLVREKQRLQQAILAQKKIEVDRENLQAEKDKKRRYGGGAAAAPSAGKVPEKKSREGAGRVCDSSHQST